MKKILLAALLAIGVSSVSLAQGPPSPEDQVAQLKTSLTLTDAQVAKIKPIYVAQSKSMDSLFNGGGGDFQAAFPKMRTIMTANQAKIKALLTPEQTVIFQKQIDAMNERFKNMPGQN